jgi:hypothetical protein
LGNDSIASSYYETALLIDEQQEDIWHEYLLLLFSESNRDGLFLKEPFVLSTCIPKMVFLIIWLGFAHMMNDHCQESHPVF